MANRRRKLVAGLAALIAFSLVVCPLGSRVPFPQGANAQVAFTFTPHVTRLAMTQTALALRIQYDEDGEHQEEIRVLLGEGLWRIEGLNSSRAMERCGGEAFTFGNAAAGMCLVPGGGTYYIWISRGEVLEIEVRPGDQNQAGFRAAVEAIASDREDIERDGATLGLSIIGLLVSAIGLGPACATIIGCNLGVGGVMLSVGGIALGNGNLTQDRERLAIHSARATYFYCLLQRRNDAECREGGSRP